MSIGVLTVFYFIKLGALMTPPLALEGAQAHEESPVVPHVTTPPTFSQEAASTFSQEAASAHLTEPRTPQTSWPVVQGKPETSKATDEYEGTGNAPSTKNQKESEPLPNKNEQNRVFPPRDDQNEDNKSDSPLVEEPKPTFSSTQHNGADESNVVGFTTRIHDGQDASTVGANDVVSRPHVHGTHQTTTSENRDSDASFKRTDQPSWPRVHDGPRDTNDDAAALGTPRVFDPVPASEPDSSPPPVSHDADAEKSLVAGSTAGVSTPSVEIDEGLAQFLQLARLSQYASALLDIGVETMEDLQLLVREDIDELKSVGMKRVQLLRLEQMLLHRPSTNPLRTSTSENEEDVDETDSSVAAQDQVPSQESAKDEITRDNAAGSVAAQDQVPSQELVKDEVTSPISTGGNNAAELQDTASSVVATNVHSQRKVDDENSGDNAAGSVAAQVKVPSQESAKDEITTQDKAPSQESARDEITTKGNENGEDAQLQVQPQLRAGEASQAPEEGGRPSSRPAVAATVR
ncbi:Hypothetical Protein FCC1311_053442 [Hondaea fermentalgiana]|uniref:SAM domain-containing protein n=1 Tax=Hondaea fermentalgiana TaxID=2315210 RepID=A0A2R5GLG6_9STRA|nr:Hypothetical Protein FCC1311_053442 [Hondaea fermentalgiana]|eukprot:GBG29121.1 Hypothetical Protein FCC1311_053442 [Hondaea fermentalgiana]